MAFLTTQHWKFIINISVECVLCLLDDYSPICTLWLWCKQVLKSHLSIYSDQISAPLSKQDICLMLVWYISSVAFFYGETEKMWRIFVQKREHSVFKLSVWYVHLQCNKKKFNYVHKWFYTISSPPIGAVQIIHTPTQSS